MSFLSPWMLVAGVAAALGVVALHLLTTRRPPPAPLPTARFVPESDVRAVARARRPTDPLLLALRALAVLAIGAAFARPVADAPGPSVRTVLVLEWTSGLADVEAVRAQARELLANGDALVVFDTAARELPIAALDSLGVPYAMLRRAALSPAIVAARAAAARIARGADSVRLVVLASANREMFDASTHALRASWPGRVELVAVAAVADTAVSPAVEIVAAGHGEPTGTASGADDPLRVAVPLLPRARGRHDVRIVRSAPQAADFTWVRARSGRVLVVWPHEADSSAGVEPDGVLALGVTLASAGDLAAGSRAATLVAPLARVPVPDDGHVIARWRDGTVAASERAVEGSGSCVRHVGVGVPAAGDLTLRPVFTDFFAAMLAPCGGARSPAVADSALGWLTARGPLAASADVMGALEDFSPLVRWLLLLALALLVAEQWLRRRPAREAA